LTVPYDSVSSSPPARRRRLRVPHYLALGAAGAIALVLVAGYLFLWGPVHDPAPHPDLGELQQVAAAFVYPGAKQVSATDVARHCFRGSGLLSQDGCTGPHLTRSYTVTATQHQVVGWFASTATARGWQPDPTVTGIGFVDPNQVPDNSIAPDPRGDLCAYTKGQLSMALSTCFGTKGAWRRTDWSDWDTVETVRFDVLTDRGTS
jgi:hypothetical protein